MKAEFLKKISVFIDKERSRLLLEQAKAPEQTAAKPIKTRRKKAQPQGSESSELEIAPFKEESTIDNLEEDPTFTENLEDNVTQTMSEQTKAPEQDAVQPIKKDVKKRNRRVRLLRFLS